MSAIHSAELVNEPARVSVFRLPYNSTTRVRVMETVALWEQFIQLPLEVKKLMLYQPDKRMSGVGYEYKEGIEGVDRKENIHLQLAERACLWDYAHKTGETVAIDLVEASLELIDYIKPLVREFVADFSEQYELPNFWHDVERGADNWMLRFLHYFGGCESGYETAYRHVDKGCFTPHLFESDPGLQWRDAKGVWHDVNLTHDETVILPGLRLQHRTRCEVDAVCHRVIATEQTAKMGRVSAVCFVDSDYPFFYDKDRCKRTQDQPEGFNYGLPFDEFHEKYFRT